MKKIISLFLALLMAFSVVTVAFAEDATAPEAGESTTLPEGGETEGEENEGSEDGSTAIPDLGEFDWILDLPFWTVGPAFKLAKIAFKLVKAYLKVAKIFGMVDQDMEDMIVGVITDMIKNAQNGEAEQAPGTDAPTDAPADAPTDAPADAPAAA